MSTPLTAPDASSQTPLERPRRRVVVALGGNAITQPGDDGSVATDYSNLKRSLRSVVIWLACVFCVWITIAPCWPDWWRYWKASAVSSCRPPG